MSEAERFWELASLAETAGGELLRTAGRRTLGPTFGAAIDTRALRAGQVFFAFRGEKTDGHGYLGAAQRAGAAAAFVTDADAARAGTVHAEELGLIRVDDAEGALLKLAAAWRDRLATTRVIGVAGSAGKTTTKELIGSVLARKLAGSHSPKSFNNRLGVSLTLLNARPGDDYVVCEIGTSGRGETAELSRVVRPDIGVIVSLGREHLEGLGGLAGVAEESAGLLEGLGERGLLLVNGDERLLLDATAAHGRRRTFGRDPACDLHVTGVETDWDGCRFEVSGERFAVRLLGAHNAHNAAAAVGACRELGLSNAEIAQGLRAAEPAPMRLEPTEVGGVRLINDAYNAHPESLAASIDLMAQLDAGDSRRVLVLGDMLELGEEGPALHREAADRIVRTRAADVVLLVGSLAAEMAPALAEGGIVAKTLPATDEGMEAAARLLGAGDVALLKASRGVRLERVAAALESMLAKTA